MNVPFWMVKRGKRIICTSERSNRIIKKIIAFLLNLNPFLKKFKTIIRAPVIRGRKANGENTIERVVLETSIKVTMPIRNLFVSRVI